MTSSTPEDSFVGLQFLGKGNEEPLKFSMPRFDKTAANSTLSFTLESLGAILKAKDLLPDLARTLTFVATKHVGAYAISIALSELFDTAVADMLDTVGDASMKAAVRALQDAKSEPSPGGKTRHRQTAEGLLRLAYDGYEASIKHRRGKALNFLMSSKPEVELHCKATQSALTIASISKQVDLHAAVRTWADNSKHHFLRYITIVKSEAEFTVDRHNKTYGKGFSVSRMFDPYPLDSFLRSEAQAKDAIVRWQQVNREQVMFARVFVDLIRGT
jgi:hypothetical protein